MVERFSTFHAWLLANYPPEAPGLGDLATQLAQDEEFPTSAGSWPEVEQYLRSSGASGTAVELARRAWGQYAAERRDFEVAELTDELVAARG